MTTKNSEPVQLQSVNSLGARIEQVKRLFPEAVNEDGIDFDTLANLLGRHEARTERYNFTWAGKQDAILSLHTRGQGTLKPVPEESVNWEDTKNIFIEGDNLEVLKLLYKSYFGRVKMIYIDPPYNTGNDFVYPDDYSAPLDQYLRYTGQVDDDGNLQSSNVDRSGRKHSSWLSMMYPRLFLARQLLRDDGAIVIHIDDTEIHNLRHALNEIFGEENFVAQIIWKSRQFPDSRSVRKISTDHEYILVYSKQQAFSFRGVDRDESKFKNPDNDPRGDWMSRSILGLATAGQRPNLHYDIIDPETGTAYSPPSETGWRYEQHRMSELISEKRILFPSKPDGRPREKKFRSDLLDKYISFPTIVDDVYTAHGTSEIRDIFGYQAFDFPKPTEIAKRLIEQIANDNEIILDFFAGSATTAHAVLQQNREDGCNRKFILVQLPEPMDDTQYANIADVGKERIRRVIQRMGSEREGQLDGLEARPGEDLGFRVFRLDESPVRPWEGMPSDGTSPDEYAKQMELIVTDPLRDGWTVADVIAEVTLKDRGFSLTYAVKPIAAIAEQNIYRVDDYDKEQHFYICLDEQISFDIIKQLALTENDPFVFRDRAADDTAIANLALTCAVHTI